MRRLTNIRCLRSPMPPSARPPASRSVWASARHPRSGLTIVELLIGIIVVGIMAGIGVTGVRRLTDQQGGERVARAVLWEVTVARTYALRSGDPISLVADRTNRQLITRNSFGEVYRRTPYSTGTDLLATSLSTNLPGDSLAFSSRGYCLNCAVGGSSALTVVARNRSYSMTINQLGRVQLVGQPAN